VERNRAVNLPALDPGAVAGEHTPLPPGTLRGDAHRLQQYPALTLATSKQLAAAKRLVEQVWSGTRRWLEPAAAAAAGYGTSRVPRRHGDRTIHWMHAEHRGFYDGRTLDPRRPQNLIYANVPGEPLVLVGVMYAVRRGVHGPTPGGPVTRWHQ